MCPESPEATSSTLRLACASYWPSTGSPLGHLLGLRQRLLRAVTACGVRVAVLHRAQWLLHWVEGAPGAVDMAWQRIQRMPELEASRLLHRSFGPQTLNQPLHIAAVFRKEWPEQVGRRIAQLAHFPPPGAEPACIWNALAAPAQVPPCGSMVIASAREHDDVDLLRRLAQRHDGEVVYRRFAGADPAQFDSGAAYADFAGPCRCSVRVHVLSRRCLRNELVLGELANVRDLVLLLGSRASLCQLLAQAAVELLRTQCAGARVHLLASEPASVALAGGLLRDAGVDATVRTRTLRSGEEEADYLEVTLASMEGELPGACPSWDRGQPALAA